MASLKKFNGSTWLDSKLRKLDTASDTITTLPAAIYANDTTATVGLKGQMVQSGTPSPQNPVIPQGTGERTGNLFSETLTNGYTLNNTTGLPSTYPKRCATLTPVMLDNINSITLSYKASLNSTRCIYTIFNGDTFISRVTAVFSNTTIDVSTADRIYLCFYDTTDTKTVTANDVSEIMIVEGSTAPSSYIPYGIEIPISSAGQITPVYLGDVETTRRVKKLVLDGTENWSVGSEYLYTFIDTFVGGMPYSRVICTHAQHSMINNTGKALFMKISDFSPISSVTDFKSYLAAQYAAGTPVTVWYVLATETTGIVNEPLMKIGDYADSISGITIPTITGKDTFDVETTLKPSEVSLSYTGWHDATVKEWDGSDWQ